MEKCLKKLVTSHQTWEILLDIVCYKIRVGQLAHRVAENSPSMHG